VTRIKFLNGMGQRASQPSGSPPTSQGRVRSANVPGTCAGDTSANNNPTKDYRNSATSAGSLTCQLSTGRPSLNHRMRATHARTITGPLRCPLPFSGESSPAYPWASTSTARSTLAFSRLSACLPLLGQRGSAICCTVPRSESVKLTEDIASPFSGVASQLRARDAVSMMNAQPTPRAAIGLTFDAGSLSPGCDRETNTESQGDLSCRRNKRTRLPRSVRLLYENRSGDRIW